MSPAGDGGRGRGEHVSVEPTADAVVIGGGVIGASVAFHLARKGAGRVALVERQFLAAESSGRSSALVRTHYSHPVFIRWALQGLRVFERWDEVVGSGDCGFTRTGYMVLAAEADRAALEANVARQREAGVRADLLTPEEARRLEPDLYAGDIVAAAWEPESGYADPAGTTAGFGEAARRLGARVYQGCEAVDVALATGRVQAVRTTRGTIATRVVVDAAGAWAARIARMVGIDLPIASIKHDIGIYQQPPGFRHPAHATLSDRPHLIYIRSELGGLTLVGSTDPYEGERDIDPDRYTDRPDSGRLQSFGERLTRRFPAFENGFMRRGYAGLYHMTPDHQPILGPVPGIEGFFCACGFCHGFKLSPVIGDQVSECILKGLEATPDLPLFRATRFQEGDLIKTPNPYVGGHLT